MSFDPRFTVLHPATEAWWKQREKCRKCAHVKIDGGVLGNEVWTCKVVNHQHKSKKRVPAFCIDARLPSHPCGPSALLFKPKGK